MNNKINASEIQRKGLKRVYEEINKYESFIIENNRQEFTLYLTKYKNNLGQVVQIIRENKLELEKIGLNSLHIFGSLASGRATSNSDVDIAFDIKEKNKLGLLQVINITEKVKEILQNKISHLDIHYIGTLKQSIRKDISLEGINVF